MDRGTRRSLVPRPGTVEVTRAVYQMPFDLVEIAAAERARARTRQRQIAQERLQPALAAVVSLIEHATRGPVPALVALGAARTAERHLRGALDRLLDGEEYA